MTWKRHRAVLLSKAYRRQRGRGISKATRGPDGDAPRGSTSRPPSNHRETRTDVIFTVKNNNIVVVLGAATKTFESSRNPRAQKRFAVFGRLATFFSVPDPGEGGNRRLRTGLPPRVSSGRGQGAFTEGERELGIGGSQWGRDACGARSHPGRHSCASMDDASASAYHVTERKQTKAPPSITGVGLPHHPGD
jgi:hypothetical protein